MHRTHRLFVAALIGLLCCTCTAQNGDTTSVWFRNAMQQLHATSERYLAEGDSVYALGDLKQARGKYLAASVVTYPPRAFTMLKSIDRQMRYGLDDPTDTIYPRPKHAKCWAFHVAVGENDTAAVRDMAADPTLISATDNDGNSPLHVAADSNALATMEYLLRHGARVSALDSAGRTPMHHVRSAEAANLLARHGASVATRDHQGRTPLIICSGPDDEDPSVALLAALLALGADVNERAYDGTTPLIAATCGGYYHIDAVAALLNAGADINARNSNGLSALDGARHNFREDLAAFLVARGAR